jgi:hypothetical protein
VRFQQYPGSSRSVVSIRVSKIHYDGGKVLLRVHPQVAMPFIVVPGTVSRTLAFLDKFFVPARCPEENLVHTTLQLLHSRPGYARQPCHTC